MAFKVGDRVKVRVDDVDQRIAGFGTNGTVVEIRDDSGYYVRYDKKEVKGVRGMYFLENEIELADHAVSDLRTCPFCDAPMQKVLTQPDGESVITCNNCGAIGPNESTVARAKKMWNMRRPADALLAVIVEIDAARTIGQVRRIIEKLREKEINHQ